MKLKKCLVCSNTFLLEFTELGRHPLADSFIKKKDVSKKIPSERLTCNFCKICNHLQLKYIIKANKRYNFVDYSYTSSNSKISRDHLNSYYSFLTKEKSKIQNIAEIGANDGYLISRFKKNVKKICFEPSDHMDNILREKKLQNIKTFFENTKKNYLDKFKNYFDLVIANNVVNHSDNPNKFFLNLKKILKEDGLISIEVPYAPWMIKKNKFDLIYHEHINYFSIKSFITLCLKNKLFINKILFPNYHGKMTRLLISKKNIHYKIPLEILNYEKNIFKYKHKFNHFIKKLKKKFLKKINLIKKNKQNIVIGVGASTKANTFINFMEFDNKKINFMTDSSRFKIGKYTPKSLIEIKQDIFLKKIKNKNIYLFFPTWNISSYLKKKIIKLNRKIKFINV